jgi:hypothetical protein
MSSSGWPVWRIGRTGRLRHELGRAGVVPVPSRSTAYRVLIRHQLVQGRPRKRRREDYRRWERPVPMQLWQLDVMGSVLLVDRTECKLISGVDDHSRFAEEVSPIY